MINLKVLSTAAILALVLPLVTPEPSYAQAPPGARAGGGGGGRPAAAAAVVSVAVAAVAASELAAAAFVRMAVRPQQPVAASEPAAFVRMAVLRQAVYRGGGGGADTPIAAAAIVEANRGGGGFIPGAVAGAVIGGAIASQYPYGYGGYYDGGPAYYDDQYVDDGAVAVAPAPGGDDAAYCAQRFRSYDPGSGTYLGNDGLRHPCP